MVTDIFIVSVEPLEDHMLRVNWRGGSITYLNMKPLLNGIRFGALRDEDVWKNVTTDGRFITWISKYGTEIDMAEYEVHAFADEFSPLSPKRPLP